MTEFARWAKQRRAEGHHALAKRIIQEGRMASALVKACLAKGYMISVYNGEDWALIRGKAYREVMDALWQTDEEVLVVRNAAKEIVGRFWLVYGNSGSELVSDYSANAACDEIWNELEPVRNRLEEEER